MRVFGDAVDGREVSLGGGVSDPLSVGRPGGLVLTAPGVGDLAHLSVQINGENIRVVVGVGIGFMIREEGYLITTRAKAQRVIIKWTHGELARLWRIHVRYPDVRPQTIGKRGPGFVLDAIDHARVVVHA